MVARAGGYYVEPFCRERDVAQGDPFLPNILNEVVEKWSATGNPWCQKGTEAMAGTTSAAMKRPNQRDE